jgi:hypothetical protein
VSLHGTCLPCWHTAPTARTTVSLHVTCLFSHLSVPCSRKPVTVIIPTLVSHTERLNGRVKMLATKDNGGCRNRNAVLRTGEHTRLPLATLFKTSFDSYLRGPVDMRAGPVFWIWTSGCVVLSYGTLYMLRSYMYTCLVEGVWELGTKENIRAKREKY